jgi:hypothetical protein
MGCVCLKKKQDGEGGWYKEGKDGNIYIYINTYNIKA